MSLCRLATRGRFRNNTLTDLIIPILPSSAQLNPTPTSVGWAEIALISTFTHLALGIAQSQLVIYYFFANFQAQSQKINLLSSSILDWTPYIDLGDKLWTSYTDLSDNLWTPYTDLGDNLWTPYTDLGDTRQEDFDKKSLK